MTLFGNVSEIADLTDLIQASEANIQFVQITDRYSRPMSFTFQIYNPTNWKKTSEIR